MISIVRTEWLKLKHYTPFWVLMGTYAMCVGGVVTACLCLQNYLLQDPARAKQWAATPPFAFPYAWQTVGWMASFLQFLPAMLIILNVTNEFSFRSHRQNLLEGWSRLQFLLAKVAVSLGITLYCTAVVALLSLTAAAFSSSAPSMEGFQFVLAFALQTFLFTIFAMMLAFFIRRSAFATVAFLVYTAVGEHLLWFFINYSFKGGGNYLPLHVVNLLLPPPWWRSLSQNHLNKDFFAQPPDQALVVAAFLYLVLFVTLTWGKFRKEDL